MKKAYETPVMTDMVFSDSEIMGLSFGENTGELPGWSKP